MLPFFSPPSPPLFFLCDGYKPILRWRRSREAGISSYEPGVWQGVVRAGCDEEGGLSPGRRRGDQGIVVVMTPYANPIKEVSIQFAGLVARSGVLEGAVCF